MQYKVVCEEDKWLVESAIDSLLKLVCGSKNISLIEYIKQVIKDRVRYVVTYPNGTENQFVSKNRHGCAGGRQSEGYYKVFAYSCKDLDEQKYKKMRKTITHEFCHILTFVLPELLQTPDIKKNGMTYKNHHGMIIKNTERVCTYFGVVFNEPMMDLIALWAINKFVDTSVDVNMNDLFNKSRYQDKLFTGWDEEYYGWFRSLVWLAIVAMSNVGTMNYDELINDGQGVFNMNRTMRNGKKCKANDFLYGILFNPLHIMQEYEQFMGPGSYEEQCVLVDNVLNKKRYAEHKLNWYSVEQDIAKYIKNWQDFFNKKMAYYRQNGMIDDTEYMHMVGRFRETALNVSMEYKRRCVQKQQQQYAKNTQNLGG